MGIPTRRKNTSGGSFDFSLQDVLEAFSPACGALYGVELDFHSLLAWRTLLNYRRLKPISPAELCWGPDSFSSLLIKTKPQCCPVDCAYSSSCSQVHFYHPLPLWLFVGCQFLQFDSIWHPLLVVHIQSVPAVCFVLPLRQMTCASIHTPPKQTSWEM